jgi:hypothetical protein
VEIDSLERDIRAIKREYDDDDNEKDFKRKLDDLERKVER